MKLFLITQTDNSGYDTYDSAVVAAENSNAARYIHPSRQAKKEWWKDNCSYGPLDTWALPAHVQVTFLGKAKYRTKPGVICASFNAG